MPLIGILVGRYVGLRLGTLAVYIGAIILIGLGMHTLRETLGRDHETPSLSFESIRGIFLAGLGISTDEIAMGFPLGALGLPIIAVLTAIWCASLLRHSRWDLTRRRIGMALGRMASRIAGIVAGAAFLLLGIYVLVERILSDAG
jgi:putative Mn2+ efflux pump MntP